MTCCVLMLTEGRIVALHAANWVQPCPDWLLPSQGESREKVFFPFSHPFLLSLSLNCACVMSWHLFFQFLYPLFHSSTLSLPVHAHTFSCFSFSSSNVLPAGIHNAPDGRKEMFCYQETFFSPQYFTFNVQYSMPKI